MEKFEKIGRVPVDKDPDEDREIIFSRHLNEIDDLETFGRDAPLCDSPENDAHIERTSNVLAEKLIKNKRRAVLFVVSPRIRAIQTADRK